MARARLTHLSDGDRAFVHEQAVRVLEDMDIGYNTPEAIELLCQPARPGCGIISGMGAGAADLRSDLGCDCEPQALAQRLDEAGISGP